MSKLDEKSNATLALIPRAAKKIAIVGDKSAQIGTVFHHLSPNCEQERFPNSRRFLQHLEDEHHTKWDAVILTAQAAQAGFPLEVLKKSSATLTAKGMVIFEVRNPFHFKQLDRKIMGQGSGSSKLSTGLIEKAEQFSTRLKKEIKGAGLRIDRYSRLADEAGADWLEKSQLANGLSDGQKNKLLSLCSTSAMLFRLTQSPMPQIRIQAKILKPVGGVNDIRINHPLAALQTMAGVNVHISENQSVQKTMPHGIEKVFLWQRPVMTFANELKAIQALRQAGYLIIVDFDDHPSPWPAIAENNYLTFAGAHAVQTTNEALASFIRKHNPEVGVFQNQLNHLPARDFQEPSNTARIFFGALNRAEDYKSLLPLLNAALSKFEFPYHFDVVGDESFFEQLQTERKSFYPRATYREYLNVLETADIALMPLKNGEFNRMKSDLKMVEASGSGAVPIASNVVYEQTDPNSDFSEICKDDSAFIAALVKLVNNPAARLEKQIKGRAFVEGSRMLSDHCQSRYDWLASLISKRNELDYQLGKRLQRIIPK